MMMISLFLPAMEFGKIQFEKVFIFFLQTSSFVGSDIDTPVLVHLISAGIA